MDEISCPLSNHHGKPFHLELSHYSILRIILRIKFIRIPNFTYGRGGFSGHAMTNTLNTYGSDKQRILWIFRNHMLDNLNQRFSLNIPDHRQPIHKRTRLEVLVLDKGPNP